MFHGGFHSYDLGGWPFIERVWGNMQFLGEVTECQEWEDPLTYGPCTVVDRDPATGQLNERQEYGSGQAWDNFYNALNAPGYPYPQSALNFSVNIQYQH